jgi:hypothetical protein
MPDAANDRMLNVLSKMQLILARMRYGPDRVLCTNNFASALGLKIDKMQDPNEFARLLFNRMVKSFRRLAESKIWSAFKQQMSGGLGSLLPLVFSGTEQIRRQEPGAVQ